MGCWSESCAISGLEIGYDMPALVMLVKAKDSKAYTSHGTFSRFTPVCPPVIGNYSDYGDLDDDRPVDSMFFNLWLETSRRVFDPTGDDHMTYIANMWWVRKDIWDFCDNLPHEFSYGDRPKTVGESIVRHRAKFAEYIDKIQKHNAGAASGDLTDDEVFVRALARLKIGSDDLFGFRSYDVDIINGMRSQLDDAIKTNNQVMIDNIVEASCRLSKLDMICFELRKVVAPSTMNGPQHGGYEAVGKLADFVSNICQESLKDFDGEED